MDKPLLELIIIHTDEPWETGKPLFDSIEYQSCVEWKTIAITIVQAGRLTALPWDELLAGYSFKPQIVTIDSNKVSDAKNAGIASARTEWITFFNFKDMFADVCALSMMTEHLPTNDFDVIWGKYVVEQRWGGGTLYIQRVEESNFYTTDCKMYRKMFLQEHKIRFDGRVETYSDYLFNSVLLAETTANRIVLLTTPFFISICKNIDMPVEEAKKKYDLQIADRFRRDLVLSDIFRMRRKDFDSDKKLIGIICSEYFRVYDLEDGEPDGTPSEEFMRFYRKNRGVLKRVSSLEVEAIKDETETETMGMIQHFYNQHKLEYYLVNDTMSFDEWLDHTNGLLENEPRETERQDVAMIPERTETARQDTVRELKPVVIRNDPMVLTRGATLEIAHLDEPEENPDTVPAPVREPERAAIVGQEPRVAVYCGTYNTYLDILTSAKSLLWHTRMDKIYFLIEDDVFPYELPDNDIIECINVKDQKWFGETGPNYNNSWSYMCMMRAAFTKLIPYDKILSLDIDVVIQEDIGCLWDIDLKDYYLAGVEEPQRKKQSSDPLYINFGVVMMNLKKLREDHLDDKIIEALNKNKFLCPEQDAFNQFCAYKIYRLPNDYNATIHSHITGDAEKERIVHFAGIRFWRHFGPIKEYGNRKWELVMERQRELQ